MKSIAYLMASRSVPKSSTVPVVFKETMSSSGGWSTLPDEVRDLKDYGPPVTGGYARCLRLLRPANRGSATKSSHSLRASSRHHVAENAVKDEGARAVCVQECSPGKGLSGCSKGISASHRRSRCGSRLSLESVWHPNLARTAQDHPCDSFPNSAVLKVTKWR